MMERLDVIFTDSWRLLRHNLVLFVPNILMFVFSFGVLGLFLHLLGLLELFVTIDAPETGSLMLAQFWLEKRLTIIAYAILYGLMVFLVDNFFATMKFGMIRDVVVEGRTSLGSGIKFGCHRFFTVLVIRFLSFLMIFGPIVLFGYLAVILIPKVPALMYLVLLFVIAAIAYVAMIGIRLLFVYPTMAFEDDDSLTSIAHDFHYVKTHMSHTIIVWLIILSVMIGGYAIRSSLLTFRIGMVGIIGISAILIMIELTISVWEHVFLFDNYYKDQGSRTEGQKT